MTMYNLINGVNPAVILILPMLGKHYNEYPRFRDCFLSDPERPEYEGSIHVYTRVGGGNREYYSEEIEELRSSPHYVDDYDNWFDCTYATFVFQVPDEWRDDFKILLETGDYNNVSEAYKEQILKVYPEFEGFKKEIE